MILNKREILHVLVENLMQITMRINFHDANCCKVHKSSWTISQCRFFWLKFLKIKRKIKLTFFYPTINVNECNKILENGTILSIKIYDASESNCSCFVFVSAYSLFLLKILCLGYQLKEISMTPIIILKKRRKCSMGP